MPGEVRICYFRLRKPESILLGRMLPSISVCQRYWGPCKGILELTIQITSIVHWDWCKGFLDPAMLTQDSKLRTFLRRSDSFPSDNVSIIRVDADMR